MAARAGLTTLIIEVEGKSGLTSAFGRADALTYDLFARNDRAGPASVERCRKEARLVV